MGISIEELRDYCDQLCREGKGGGTVSIACSGVGSCDSADPYNDKLDWWEVTGVGYNGALRILASDVYYDKLIDKKDVRSMVKDLDTALNDLRRGDIASLKDNICAVQNAIDSLLAEVS